MKALIYDLVMLIVSNRTDLSIPDRVRTDRLMETGDSISIAMRGVPKVAKEYINGAKHLTATFDVLAITDQGASDAQSLQAVDWLEAIGALFEGMNRYTLSTSRTITKATQTTMPTIVGRTAEGRISYVITVSIEYEENKEN